MSECRYRNSDLLPSSPPPLTKYRTTKSVAKLTGKRNEDGRAEKFLYSTSAMKYSGWSGDYTFEYLMAKRESTDDWPARTTRENPE